MKKQQGFTLIELIVVIVILGILAATALPRFADLQGDARMASANAALGSIRSAAAIAHGQWLLRNQPASSVIEGVTVVYANGYPDVATMAAVAGITADSYSIVTGPPLTVTPLGSTLDQCTISYTAASAIGSPPTIVTVPAVLNPVNC